MLLLWTMGLDLLLCNLNPLKRVFDTLPCFKANVFFTVSYFSFQPVLHNWCNKGRGMCYPVCGMAHIKHPLLPIVKE